MRTFDVALSYGWVEYGGACLQADQLQTQDLEVGLVLGIGEHGEAVKDGHEPLSGHRDVVAPFYLPADVHNLTNKVDNEHKGNIDGVDVVDIVAELV